MSLNIFTLFRNIGIQPFSNPENIFEEISDCKNEQSEIPCNEFTLMQIQQFISLTDKDIVINQFLEFDHCYTLADKYLLAIVFVYFRRANLSLSEYNRDNFFLALYLAHDIEEDDESFKEHVITWALGRTRAGQKAEFLKARDKFWMRIGYRAFVSLQCCQQVMDSTPESPLWQRERSLDHICDYEVDNNCPNCNMEEGKFYHSDLESNISEDSDYSIEWSDESCSPPQKKIRTEE